MKIINAFWTDRINYLVIVCDKCGAKFPYRVDKWYIVCKCGNRQHRDKLKIRMEK